MQTSSRASPPAAAFASPSAPPAAALGRKNSSDDLVADVTSSPPVHTPSDARLLYREWRTGSQVGADLTRIDSVDAVAPSPPLMSSEDVLSRSPFGVFGRSPSSLPRIAERLENLPIRANVTPAAPLIPQDAEARAQLLSQKLKAQGGPEPTKPLAGSYERRGAAEPATSMKKAQSYQALAELEKKGYFPAAPKPSALGVQRGLKNSVVNDMCRAVVKHMVGDVYVSASGSYGQRKVLNHLYEPVFASVQAHFRRLPARYALSVNPDDVPMHMRLLAKNQRDPTDIAVNAQLKKDDNGDIVPNVCEVVVVSLDRDNMLDAITRALTTMKGNILDADVMTTQDGTLLDRFVVKGTFMSDERQEELLSNIQENLRRLSMDDGTRFSDELTLSAFAVARQQMRPALPRQTPVKIGELIEHCWHHDPARRPDFGSILEALPLVKKSLKKRDFKNMSILYVAPAMGLCGCCARCCACAVLTQLVAVACALAIIPAAYFSYAYYLKPWGEAHYDAAVAAAQSLASQAGSVDVSGLSCGDCLGVNVEFPISALNTNYSTFQVALMNDAGRFLSVATSSGVAIAGAAALSSTIVGVLASASAVPSANGGVFELLHLVAQGQFITLLGSLNLEGVPVFFLEFCAKFGWTNLQIFPSQAKSASNEAADAAPKTKQRVLASDETTSSLDGVSRYAKALGVDPDHLFYYTLLVLASVSGAAMLISFAARLVLRMYEKENSPVAEMLDNRVVWAGIQLLLLLQYALAMTACFQISYSVRNSSATGGLMLAVVVLITSCVGLAAFGVFILWRHKRELVDHGTEEHEKKPFNHRYGSFYQDFTKENRYFFVAKMALDVASGAVVGAGRDAMLQIGLLVAFNAIFIVLMIVRRPYLLRVFYVVGMATSYLRVVTLLLTLVLVSPDLVPQHVRDLVSQIIICANALVLLCLFARVVYVAVMALRKWLQNRKQSSTRSSDSVDAEDLLAIESGVAARERGRVPSASSPAGPQTPPVDSTPPSAQSYRQTTDRFAAGSCEGADKSREARQLV
ncbi:hypothetical protein BBJ28_00001167 [Nothophytophthora sp. Chile5]|nr:hypothetical protein BBJ28_00001167 [Nothophytophthora sp. Chile5]